ncbi:MAG TPA: hypothetical protein VM427_08450 [Patescibacteria group bacterium]|nr:hypothetical protein [Patescibacteria group bacterium]
MKTGDALRQTSDALLRDLDVLVTLEEEKRSLDPGDDRLVGLAGRIEAIAQRILSGSVRQHQLTQTINAQVEAGSAGAPDASIDETPRPIQAVLADWREAERRAAAAEPGSADAAEADARVISLREEYRRAHEAIRRDR